MVASRDGNGVGRVWRMRPLPLSRMVLSCLIPTSPRMTGKIFLPHPRPLGPHKAPPHLTSPCKTLLLVNLLTTITIVFNKTYFVSKNILEITINLSYQIKLIFSKNWMILLKCLYHNKNKNLIIKNQWFNSIQNFFIIKTKENVKIGTLFPTLLEKKKRLKALLSRIK